VKRYLQDHCLPETNDCESNVFSSDCTHFVCHALNKTGVYVKLPSADCKSGLCIRVNDLAASFVSSTQRYTNVTQVADHAETREGDYCFIPGWFGTRDHVMVLAATAMATGARVWGHTSPRCAQFASFEGQECVYYRIGDVSG
jgi:hypothetical protein